MMVACPKCLWWGIHSYIRYDSKHEFKEISNGLDAEYKRGFKDSPKIFGLSNCKKEGAFCRDVGNQISRFLFFSRRAAQRSKMKSLVLNILNWRGLLDVQVEMLNRQLDISGWGLGENSQKNLKLWELSNYWWYLNPRNWSRSSENWV